MKTHIHGQVRILRLVVLCVALLAAFPTFSQPNRQLSQERRTEGSKRTALVIGNAKYETAPLRNPANDATDITAALKSLGFEVLSYTDLDQKSMKRVIREFGAKLRASGGVGLFYYAGHGVQVKGINYLIPVGANVDTEEEVEYESVEAGLVLAQMESAKNQMNVVILDACRNNPFVRSYRSAEKGLAQINAPSGSLVAYSTAPGSVASDGSGRNGVYTHELLKMLKTPGLSIEDVFKQVRVSVRSATAEKQTPWESSSLTGAFYFSGSGVPNAAPAYFPPPVAPVEKLPAAEDVLANYAAAVGADKFRSISTVVQKGTIEGEYKGQKFTGKIEYYTKVPGKSFHHAKYTNGTYTKETWDGQQGWISGSSTGTKAATAEQMLFHSINDAISYGDVEAFKKFYQSITTAGKERLGEKNTIVLDLKRSDGKLERMYFETPSNLLVRWDFIFSSVHLQKGLTFAMQIIAEDYVSLDGFQVPMTITQKGAETNIVTKFNVLDLKFNVPLDDKLFKKP